MKRVMALAIVLAAGQAAAAYKCVDEHGATVVADVPPAGCATVPIYEISKSGNVLRKMDPTPTPEQLKARREDEARRKEQARAAAEQKRKDDALLSTYSSDREIDITRDRNIDPIRNRIAGARERIAEVEKREEAVAAELEFYSAGKARAKARGKGKDAGEHRAPPTLLAEQEHLRKEKATLLASIASAEKEIETVKARYDADKKRWIEVKSAANRLPATNVPAGTRASTPAPGR